MRKQVRFFCSYASKDSRLVAGLLELLLPHLKASRAHEHVVWEFRKLVAGDRWHERIQDEIATCDLGMLFLSPEFLASDYIKQHELAPLLRSKGILPIGLKPVDLKAHDLQTLDDYQLFRLRMPRGELRWFSELRGRDRDAFALELFRQIEAASAEPLLASFTEAEVRVTEPEKSVEPRASVTPAPEPPATPLPPPSRMPEETFFEQHAKSLDLPRHIVATRAQLTAIRLMGESAPSQKDAVDAVPYLQAWASDPAAPPFFALLGETGSGKTTTCRLLARRMLDARATDSAAPMPIYLDLRRFSWDGKPGFTLDAILEAVLTKSFQRGTDPVPTPDDVIRHVQQQGAAALFDGLDEVIVHMTPKIAQDFIRELWRVLPPRKRDGGSESPGRPGKLLLSCRSHYFRRVWEQNTMLLGEEREGLRSQDYRALVLLPFTPEQVEEYLRHNVPGLDVERALELIGSVHNLTEMSERPFTLSLIGEFLPDLERKIASGAVIQGVDLYQAMVTRWLLRDEGKHRFNPTHKEVLMERLAAELWASARREWKIEALEDWLDDVLARDERLRGAYGAESREVLKEDLRTATFLVRPDAESFRFAHTSLQEFFLARHLQRALREGAEERWSLPIPSDETLEFLLQLVRGAPGDREASERTLAAILGSYRQLGSELALRFWLHARTQEGAFRTPPHFDLRGARLADWRFSGLPGRPIGLRNADFRGADLRRAVFEHADLSGADLSGAQVSLAELHEVTAAGAVMGSVNLTGTLWRLSALTGTDLTAAMLDRTRFIRCRFLGVSWPSAERLPIFAACQDEMGERSSLAEMAGSHLDVFTGHRRAVAVCAVSPDGRRIVSGSADSTLQVWDAASGENVLTLAGHRSGVTTCAVSPDGRRIASGSYDKTLRVWDAASGTSVLTLEGHSGAVRACVVSPDGRRIVSGSDDKTLRVWDAASGERVLTLEGHEQAILACAVSADGRRIISSSYDSSVRVWNAASGATLLALEGPVSAMSTCAMSPDGQRVVWGFFDAMLRVCDVASGETVLTLEGHSSRGVVTCVVSPDGQRIVSGSFDGTLQVWDAASGESLLTLNWQKPPSIRSCAMSPDGRWIASGSDERTVKVWDATGGESMMTLEGHTDWVRACAVSPDCQRIVSGSDDNTVRVWDTVSGESVLTLEGHDDWVMTCAVSPDGRQIVSGSDDQTLRVWDAASGESVLTLEGHDGSVGACAVSPDGRWIVSGSSDDTLRVWDAASGENLLMLEGHSGAVVACAVSPDGRRIVSGSDDNTLRVWDAASGESVLTLEGHGGWVNACAVSPDGRRIMSGSQDNTIRVWDATTGAPLLTVARLPDNNEAVFDESPRRLRRATPGAWRWLGWLARDPVTGFLERYPAESFGPLPGAE